MSEITERDVTAAADVTLGIDVVLAPKISFAAHQSAVPVLRDLRILNTGAVTATDILLDIEADPPVIAHRQWRIDRITPGGEAVVKDRDIQLNASLLLSLTEAMRGAVTLRVRDSAGLVLAERQLGVELLARTEWGGAGAMPELLAAFVLPNDPTVSRLLKAASDVLRRSGRQHVEHALRDQRQCLCVGDSVIGQLHEFGIGPDIGQHVVEQLEGLRLAFGLCDHAVRIATDGAVICGEADLPAGTVGRDKPAVERRSEGDCAGGQLLDLFLVRAVPDDVVAAEPVQAAQRPVDIQRIELVQFHTVRQQGELQDAAVRHVRIQRTFALIFGGVPELGECLGRLASEITRLSQAMTNRKSENFTPWDRLYSRGMLVASMTV